MLSFYFCSCIFQCHLFCYTLHLPFTPLTSILSFVSSLFAFLEKLSLSPFAKTGFPFVTLWDLVTAFGALLRSPLPHFPEVYSKKNFKSLQEENILKHDCPNRLYSPGINNNANFVLNQFP